MYSGSINTFSYLLTFLRRSLISFIIENIRAIVSNNKDGDNILNTLNENTFLLRVTIKLFFSF